MKKMILVLAAAAALTVTAAAPASAQACRTVKCFNKQISVLNSEVAQLSTALHCVQPVAVSRYGGYDYNGYAAATTALDFSESGDDVSSWVLAIQPGTCGSPQTRDAVQSTPKSPDAAARDAAPFGPFHALPGAMRESTKTTHGG